MTTYELHYTQDHEWAAIYVDGRVLRQAVGDSYLVEEKILALLGVKVVTDSNFLMGGHKQADAAETLELLDVYDRQMTRRKQQAAELRAKAAEMEERAKELESE